MGRGKSKSARIRRGRDTRGPLQRMADRAATEAEARQGPTAEQQQRGVYVRDKERHRRVPVIESMHRKGQLTDREYRALAHYRDQAGLAERSPVKSCLDNSQSGGGDIPLGAAITSALLETARIERDLGSLRDITHAVAVDDVSLPQWCITKHGGRERYDGKGKFVAIVPINEKRHVELAMVELRMGAHRITA